MFYEQRTSVPESPAALRSEYDAEFAAVLEGTDLEDAAATTGVDRERLAALVEGDSPELTLEEAAAIQSLGEAEPDQATIVEMACEHLLLGMTTAVLDVDALESELGLDLDAKEIQQKIERRAPMTFEEFVHLQYVIADEMP